MRIGEVGKLANFMANYHEEIWEGESLNEMKTITFKTSNCNG